jgi:hypothetical protein
MPTCAYCKLEGPVTREHVIPAFIYDFQKSLESSITGWNEVAQKMVGGELKVKDVCAVCNNGRLANLDAYGKAFLQRSEILTANYTRLSVTLPYDFDLLVPWLLKISFNSSRTDGAHRYLFEPHVPYIMGNGGRPERSKIAVLAYLASPVILSAAQRIQAPYSRVIGTSDRFNPFLLRICYGGIPGPRTYTLRMIIFGPLVFFFMVFPEDTRPGHAASDIRRFLKIFPEGVELRPERKVVALSAGANTWLDLYQYQINRARFLE